MPSSSASLTVVAGRRVFSPRTISLAVAIVVLLVAIVAAWRWFGVDQSRSTIDRGNSIEGRWVNEADAEDWFELDDSGTFIHGAGFGGAYHVDDRGRIIIQVAREQDTKQIILVREGGGTLRLWDSEMDAAEASYVRADE